MSSPTNWSHFYQQNQEPAYGEQGYDTTTAVTTTVNSSTTTGTSSGDHLSPDGRVGKPARKRSRASRRTPTTLLNTDPANFRAMVQQFTGGPSASFALGSAHRPAGPRFGLHQPHVNPDSFTVHSAGFQLQYQQQQQQYQQQQQQQQQQQYQLMQQQNQAYMFSLNSNDDVREAEGVSSEVGPPRTSSSNENMSNNNSFMF